MVKRPRNPSKPPKSAPLLTEDDASLRGQRRRPRDPAQPTLPFDAMPDWVDPCLALLKPTPPKGDKWAYEVKWDGYRISCYKVGDKVTIRTRRGHDWTPSFPAVAEAVAKLPVGSAVLDGEAVVLDEAGRSDYNALIKAIGGRSGKKASRDVVLMAFDLLYFDGHDLRRMEQEDRRHFLVELIGEEADGGIRLSQEIETDDPDALLATACAHDLEGIIAKDKTAPYKSGRGGEWIKIKCIASDGFLIVGYEPSTAALGGIGRLLLAARKGDGIVYVGSVGTGFNSRNASSQRKEMDARVISKAAVPLKKKGVVWVKPELVAEVEYRAWTSDGHLRHASFKGLRDAADADDVYEVDPIVDP